MEQAAITRTVGVAAGVFAPGHIGELTRIVPFEMVDEVLEQTGAVQRRVRLVPARVTVYLLLAAALFNGLGYQQVFDRLCAGLASLAPVRPSGSALRQARQRLGPAPMKALFDLVSGPAATTAAAGRWRGLRVVAVDGTLLPVPDCPANLAVFTRQRLGNGISGYPQLRLAALVACGTRSVIGAVFGPATTGELEYARRLAVDLRAGMLLLGDRNFASAALLNQLAATGADLLVRCKTNRKLPPLVRCRDGSTLTRIGPLTVRVIEAEISIRTAQGTRTGHYRLLTTLTDPDTHPAGELVRLYHERWEIETAYAELKSTMLGGRVLRARTPDGIEQEVWSLLTAYQALRTAMTDATDSIPGTDPDRAGFFTALAAARDQLVLAAGIITGTDIDLVGTIGRHVLAHLLPTRRVRTKDRIVKRAISKYNARGPAIDRTTYKATISINMLTSSP
ncbi:IS4 family transposase (plasmid) [Streptomyces sp. NBC_00984]|uniref:IS4 family transposase n=1 Tax=Streptomyces sp. NBC_00984 TaxID=2903700 RepID=UPI003866CC36|nr:IS4 family transposase [Streptomyces sp. NBC_00984]WSX32644.1 IS4 family transposase [Streptomyces sp. NBC_00984]WSX33294.1 IS4 family transposase [Streptomyces sp. NBC_00984]